MALTTPSVTQDGVYSAAQDRMLLASGAVQAGVVGTNDMLVSAGAGLQVNIAAGSAYVQQTGAVEGSAYNGLYYELNDATASPYNTITAPITNPRLDQVILRVYDNPELGAGGSSYARFEWLIGTETAGATLVNRNGAAALPTSSLRLADTLTTTGSVMTIGDRRPLANKFATVTSDSGWITPTLGNSWTGVGGGNSPQYRSTGNIVRLRGAYSGASGASGTVAFTLPVGFRPAVQEEFTALNNALGTNTAQIIISTSGAVSVYYTGGGNIFQSGITFTTD